MAQCCHAVAAFHTNSVNTSRLIDMHVRQKWCLWPHNNLVFGGTHEILLIFVFHNSRQAA